MREVLRWALPTTVGVSTTTLITAVATGMFEQHWARGVPSLVLVAFSLISYFELRRERLERAVRWLIVGIGAVVLLAMTMNGGLNSPSAMLLFFLVSLCGWVFGSRGASVMAGVALVVMTVYFVLGVTRVLPEPPALPLVGLYVMLVVLTVLTWTTTSIPSARMHEALIAAGRREAELKAEQDRHLAAAHQFRAVFDQSPHLMALVYPDGRIFSVNRAALEFVGLTSSETVLDTHFSKSPWWTKADAERLNAGMAHVATGKAIRYETVRVDGKGRVRNLEFALSPFRNASGDIGYLIAEGRDVTEVMLAKQRRDTTQRLELVGQLAGGVAHDFNNVLMAITSSAEVLRLDLEAEGQTTPEVVESLDTILDAGRRASELTTRLLTFGRRVAMEKRPVSVHQLVSSTVKLLERTLPANIQVVSKPMSPADLIEGEPAAIESALLNLALNARDAMPSGGVLTFSTERVELDEEWCATSGFDLKPGIFLRVSVRDTGTGIAAEHATRVFEPFFTTKDEGKGTGLGLASVFGVMREHSGAVHLYSEPGRGTVFHLTLPLSTVVPVVARAPGSTRAFNGVRALVVDDEPAIRAMLPRLLRRIGIESVVAGSAEEADDLLAQPLQLLVSDIVLPGRRGNELAKAFLAKHPAAHVLLISGFPKDTELASLPQERVQLLAKPFTFDALQNALGSLLKASRSEPASSAAPAASDATR